MQRKLWMVLVLLLLVPGLMLFTSCAQQSAVDQDTTQKTTPPADTGWAAPILVPGAMAAMSAAMVIITPAEAARAGLCQFRILTTRAQLHGHTSTQCSAVGQDHFVSIFRHATRAARRSARRARADRRAESQTGGGPDAGPDGVGRDRRRSGRGRPRDYQAPGARDPGRRSTGRRSAGRRQVPRRDEGTSRV